MAARNELEDDFVDPKTVVRTFSWKAYAEDPDDDLARSLMTAEASNKLEGVRESTLKDQWMQLFDPSISKVLEGNQDEAILANPTDELVQVYKKFLKCLPKDHEARIEDGPPSLEAVANAVNVAVASWRSNKEKTKAGRMKTLFVKVTTQLHKYKGLAAVIPSGDKYVSLVAGSISAVVKATTNHEKIAESVSSALDDLSEDIAYWKELLEIDDHNEFHNLNGRSEHYVARLYVVVFSFLTALMTKWLSKSSVARIFRSFDSEFFKEEIETKKTNIRDLERKLERNTHLSLQRSHLSIQRSIQRSVGDLMPKAEMNELIAGQQANFQFWLMKLTQQEAALGQTIKKTLEEQYKNQQKDQIAGSLEGQKPLTSQTLAFEPSMTTDEVGNGPTVYAVAQVRLDALHYLRSFIIQPCDPMSIVHPQSLNINIEVFSRVQQWSEASGSQTLWIQGPFQVPQPSRYTQLSAYMIMVAQKADVPVLYYSCDSHTKKVDLVYNLIAQIVRLIPDDFQSRLDFSALCFACLDLKEGSIQRAITLLRDLLSVGPCLLFIIIDGMQMLNPNSPLSESQELVNVLRSSERWNGVQSYVVKALFTTDGFTDALINIPGDERMSAMDFADEDGAGPETDGVDIAFL